MKLAIDGYLVSRQRMGNHLACRIFSVALAALFFNLGTAILAAAPVLSPDNPQPLEGDLVLPMPNGREMVFRTVCLGLGDKPFAAREFTLGDRTGRFQREKLVKARLGGSFVIETGQGRDMAYYLGKYEVSEDQFAAVSGTAALSSAGSLPKTNVTRAEIDNFVNAYNAWLNEHASERLPLRDKSKGFLRLPTEQEWEFAARGGVAVPAEHFEQSHAWEGRAEEYEWFAGPSSSHGKLKPVGRLKPGPLGIFDMLGNASELTDTRYELERGGGLVGGWTARGGNFRTEERDLRASMRIEVPERDASGKLSASDTVGFRLVIAAQVITQENAHDIAAMTTVVISASERLRDLLSGAALARQRGDTTTALHALEEAAKLDTRNPDIAVELALTYESAGKPEKAREQWLRLLDPAVPAHYQEIAKLKTTQDNADAQRTRIAELQKEVERLRRVSATRAAKAPIVKAEPFDERLIKAKADLAAVETNISVKRAKWQQALDVINRLTSNKRFPMQEGTQAYYLCLQASQTIAVVEKEAPGLNAEKARLEEIVKLLEVAK